MQDDLRVTYLLGAGASFNSIPIVSEFPEVLSLSAHFLQNAWRDRRPALKDHYLRLAERFKVLMRQSETFGTVDTFAKKQFLTDVSGLEETKWVLNLFFEFWERAGRVSIPFRPADNPAPCVPIDKRYFGLLANYLVGEDQGIRLHRGVNFITWNYDSQIERAIAKFTGYPIEFVLSKFASFPYARGSYENTIVHLNGMAGIFEPRGESTTIAHFLKDDIESDINKNLEEIIGYAPMKGEPLGYNREYLYFAWEDHETAREARRKAIKILNDTEYLIIIGYSFPTFNDIIDKQLLAAALRRLKKVYFQDPRASKEILSARFGIPEKLIQVVSDTSQFILPLETNDNRSGEYHFV
jgi:hypothetical protein